MRSKTVIVLALACAGLLATSASADFFLHNILDLSDSNYFPQPLFDNESPYGTNPSAVTTDGSSLWLAGFNGGTGTAAGIVKIIDPWGMPSAADVTTITSPGSRGFSGLAYDYISNVVLAAYDDGAANANGITGWNPVTGANLWAKNARGGSGVGDDPGFGGAGFGAGWTTFGSGRRALQDSVTGADIYTLSDGMIINGAGTGTFWRDMDFAPDGDIWLREGNNVILANRTGPNACDTAVLIVDEPEADYVVGQNLAYLDGLTGGDLVVYNAREGGAPGQLWADIVKLINPDGTPAAAQLLDGLGAPLDPAFAEGAAYYDFEWDAVSQALTVSDYSNRLVYRFLTYPIPEPASLMLLALGGVLLLGRRS
jgi:hypothetical protein